MAADRPLTAREIAAFRAAEIRMVADLLERDGQLDRAAEARDQVLYLDPPFNRQPV